MVNASRDHGGGLDAAIERYGGCRADWIDLSTGINPTPYPIGGIPEDAWTALPDAAATERILAAARAFWNVPTGAQIVAAPGASALIARLPDLWTQGRVHIEARTYNEHRAAFETCGWVVSLDDPDIRVVVHPNNPTGVLWDTNDAAQMNVIDESFCDVCPSESLIARAEQDAIVLKSFGKFWGLAGLRLGFAIGPEPLMNALSEKLGPWPVSGPALAVGAQALEDEVWAQKTRTRLEIDAERLDHLVEKAGGKAIGGTSLFRLYDVDDAVAWQDRLAKSQIWTRIFPYSDHWLRLGLPPADGWTRLEAAL